MSTYPGSADNGATDMEYTPERTSALDEKLAGIDEAIGIQQYALEQHIAASSAEVQAVTDTLCADNDALAGRLNDAIQRVRNLEGAIARIDDRVAGLELDADGREPDNEDVETDENRVYQRGRRDGIVAAQKMMEKLDESAWDKLSAELEELRAKWASVPWYAIEHLLYHVEPCDGTGSRLSRGLPGNRRRETQNEQGTGRNRSAGSCPARSVSAGLVSTDNAFPTRRRRARYGITDKGRKWLADNAGNTDAPNNDH